MKNLRNLMAAITLMVVLVVGANAGVLLGDRSACNTKEDVSTTASDLGGIIIGGLVGIIIGGRDGIIIGGRDGIIIGGKTATGCEQSRDGILLAD